MKKLVFCADDFALNQAVSEGIAQLAALGRVTATSAMVLSPRWARDAALLTPWRGQLDVGLHLDWTSDLAVQAGHGMSLGRAMLAAILGRFSKAQAKQVIAHQLDAFEQVWQAAPDHVDGHQHVQQFEGIRDALTQVIAERYGHSGSRPYVRISQLPAGQQDLKGRVIASMGARPLRSALQRQAIAHSPALSGIYNFEVGAVSYADRMNAWLQTSPDQTLLMCHPANKQLAGDEIGQARQREYQHLASDEFAQQLVRHGVTLVRGTGLYTSRAVV